MNRRSFIRAGLVLAAAPMIVRAESLMPVKKLYVPKLRIKEFKDVRPWIGSITGGSFAPVPMNSERLGGDLVGARLYMNGIDKPHTHNYTSTVFVPV